MKEFISFKNRIMKKLLIFIVSCLLLSVGYAQSLDRQVLSSLGSYITTPNMQLSATLGQVEVETYVKGSIILLQGFQQPDMLLPQGIGELFDELVEFKVWPNPVSDMVFLEFQTDKPLDLSLGIYDLQGRLLMPAMSLLVAGQLRHELDLSSFSPGLYLISIKEPVSGSMKTIRIEKY
jgi:hypothetical protein